MTHDQASDDRGVRIHPAIATDAALLAELGGRLFEQAFGAANDPENMRLYLAGAFGESLQRAELVDPSRDAWIARDASGAAVGYAMMRRGPGGDGVRFERPAEVQRIYVDQAWHGHGVGSALMSACIERARDQRCDGAWLCVWNENPRAIAFYERVGFRVVGATTFTLGRDVQHDRVMALPIE